MCRLITFVLLATCIKAYAFDNFITRQGHQLFDGEESFRFTGIHAPELHRIENDAKGKLNKPIPMPFSWVMSAPE